MISLYALHGFLGTPADWMPYSKIGDSVKLHPMELRCPTANSFSQWAQDFNHLAARDSNQKILLGYSLGGRLAMHALLQAPHQWKAAIIVSAHPGLKCIEMKAKRLASDLAWASKFESEPWDTLMARWNARDVLASSRPLSRDEKNYSRLELSRQLQHWSLGAQEDLQKKLAELQAPILWMAGIKDPTYANIARELHFAHSHSEIWIAPKAGHRIPWDAPEAFHTQVAQFISSALQTSRS